MERTGSGVATGCSRQGERKLKERVVRENEGRVELRRDAENKRRAL